MAQVELPDRRRWKSRIELASAIHDYIAFWHNTRRQHSALGMLTPSDVEAAWAAAEDGAAVKPHCARPRQQYWLTKAPRLVSLTPGQNQSITTSNIYFSKTTAA